MLGYSQMHGSRHSKAYSFILFGLILMVILLTFNYWRKSAHSYELRITAQEAALISRDKVIKESDEILAECMASKARVADEKKSIDAKLIQLMTDRDDDAIKHADLKATYDALEKESLKLREDLRRQAELSDQTKSNIKSLEEEKEKIIEYLSRELGRPGINYLIDDVGIAIPASISVPAAEQTPECEKNAMSKLLAQQAHDAEKRAPHRSGAIESPNMNSVIGDAAQEPISEARDPEARVGEETRLPEIKTGADKHSRTGREEDGKDMVTQEDNNDGNVDRGKAVETEKEEDLENVSNQPTDGVQNPGQNKLNDKDQDGNNDDGEDKDEIAKANDGTAGTGNGVEDTGDDIEDTGDDTADTGDDVEDMGDDVEDTGDDVEDTGDDVEDTGNDTADTGVDAVGAEENAVRNQISLNQHQRRQ